MTVKKLTKKVLDGWVQGLVATDQVMGVQAKGDRFDFAPLASARDLRLDYDVTLQPPKQFFLPPCETLLRYQIGGAYTSMVPQERLILFGVHPYDLIAINQLDQLFREDNGDVHYLDRRKNITIVAVDVKTASKNVFASSMKTAVAKEGYDVLLTDVGDGFVVEAATDKGQALLTKAKGATDAGTEDLAKRKQVWDYNTRHLNQHPLKCDPAYLPKLLDKAYKHPVWERRAKTCFSCGSCNLVCPTCYCFDVQDDVSWDRTSGTRERAWDGCLLDGFTKVAGNHEFRKARADRFRHRLYRKAKYVPAKIGGQIACVGCGRCVGACLPDIANPVAVYNELLDEIGIS
jgi:sulfhydrogenase subunit beta (sulfur reductase)